MRLELDYKDLDPEHQMRSLREITFAMFTKEVQQVIISVAEAQGKAKYFDRHSRSKMIIPDKPPTAPRPTAVRPMERIKKTPQSSRDLDYNDCDRHPLGLGLEDIWTLADDINHP